ncbi:MAG: hypothetical protein RIE60_22445 [Roseovarius sp.]|uniref:hypothetical protein n=1 Tax=Roseovarius sp. TaxID=1486281 RepID=UPI0032EBEB27
MLWDMTMILHDEAKVPRVVGDASRNLSIGRFGTRDTATRVFTADAMSREAGTDATFMAEDIRPAT